MNGPSKLEVQIEKREVCHDRPKNPKMLLWM